MEPTNIPSNLYGATKIRPNLQGFRVPKFHLSYMEPTKIGCEELLSINFYCFLTYNVYNVGVLTFYKIIQLEGYAKHNSRILLIWKKKSQNVAKQVHYIF